MKVTYNGLHLHVQVFARDSFDLFTFESPRKNQKPMRLRMTPDEWAELKRTTDAELVYWRTTRNEVKP